MEIKDDELGLVLALWGPETQEATFIEEIGEYLQAWNKLKRKAISKEEYVAEIADVYIMLQQMIFINREIFDEVYPKKLKKFRDKLARYVGGGVRSVS